MLLKHVVFNPTPLFGYSALEVTCAHMEREGWRLIEIIRHHEYESVAVFAKPYNEEEDSGA